MDRSYRLTKRHMCLVPQSLLQLVSPPIDGLHSILPVHAILVQNWLLIAVCTASVLFSCVKSPARPSPARAIHEPSVAFIGTEEVGESM